MRGSVVPFCSTASLLFSFFLLLLSTTRHQFLRSVSTARKYAHVFTYTHLFPSRMKIFDSPCRRRKLTNGIVIRLEYHADDNYSRMRRWLQVLVNGIYSGKLTGIILAYPGISKIREYSGKCVRLRASSMIIGLAPRIVRSILIDNNRRITDCRFSNETSPFSIEATKGERAIKRSFGGDEERGSDPRQGEVCSKRQDPATER